MIEGNTALPVRRRIVFSDVHEARNEFDGPYGSVRIDARGDGEWCAEIASLGPAGIAQVACRIRGGLHVVASGTPYYILHLPVSGAARTAALGQSAEVAVGRSAALFSPLTHTVWSTDGECTHLTVRMDPSFLMTQLEALAGAPAQRPMVFALSLRTDAGIGAYVERLCHFIVGEIERGTPLHPTFLTGVLESLARALLVGQPHDHSHLLERPSPPSSRTVVHFVEEYLDAHAHEPIAVADLAAHTGVSLRSIEGAFLRRRGTTPSSFLTARRLAHARRVLHGDLHVPVPDVAYVAGFRRPLTFAAAYVKAFGERPEDTRRRGLVAAGAPPTPARARGPAAGRMALLSARELEVCGCVARGMLNKQIAAELRISEATVKEHRGRAMRKLGLGSTAELVVLLEPRSR